MTHFIISLTSAFKSNNTGSNRFILLLIIALSAIDLFYIGYFLDRADFLLMITLFGFLFLTYFIFIVSGKKQLSLLIGASVFFRLLLLFATPNLSDDFYRFIWDGRLLAYGENPFLHLPGYYINESGNLPGIGNELYNKLNSPDYYSVYPPVCQYVFFICAKIFPANILGSVLIMRLVIILAELGSIVILRNLLKAFNLPETRVLLYALNPLVILELTGNLHFEAIMIFFLLLSLYLLNKNRILASAVFFCLAVGTKLLPLIFLPFFIKRIGFKRSLIYGTISFFVLAILFIPFVSKDVLINFFSSVDLYFQKFEFNASVYYLVRWAGYQIYGYNIIAITGIILGIVVFFLILLLAYFEKGSDIASLPVLMLFSLSVYFMFATVVHPWYIATLVLLTVFTDYRYAIIWSFLVILSYSAYQTEPYTENYLLIAIEYGLVFGWALYEIGQSFRKNFRFLTIKYFSNNQ